MAEGISFSHYSVMLGECIDALNIKPDGIYVDGTAGGGGHSFEIASHLTKGGRLISIDQDADEVMFIYREDYYNPDTEEKNVAELIVAKNRHGELRTVELAWAGEFTQFTSLDGNRNGMG